MNPITFLLVFEPAKCFEIGALRPMFRQHDLIARIVFVSASLHAFYETLGIDVEKLNNIPILNKLPFLLLERLFILNFLISQLPFELL